VTQPRHTLFLIAEAAERLLEADKAVSEALGILLRADGPQSGEHVPPVSDAVFAAEKALDAAYSAAMNAMAQLIAPWVPDTTPAP
jgi:hypothetical protein